MRREFLPVALGFWGIAVPLLVSVFLFCRTPAERISVGLAAGLFLLLGFLISRARS
jgi:hypothetical protein